MDCAEDTRLQPSSLHQHYPRIPRIPRISYITLFRLRISLPFCFITYTFFMYIYYLISIDLQLSRSFNSSHCKAYSYKPGSHCLLSNYLNRTTCCTINLLPHLRSHYFYYLCKCLELLHLLNERTIDLERRPYPIDERTDESKTSK